MWFDNCPAQHICQLHGIKALHELLAAVHWLGVNDCIEEIIEASIRQAKFCQQIARPEVYKKLTSHTEYALAPVGQSWNEVPELCWICEFMPTIFERSLHAMWVKRLVCSIDHLYILMDETLSTTPTLSDACYDAPECVIIHSNSYRHVSQDMQMCDSNNTTTPTKHSCTTVLYNIAVQQCCTT
jgi:hypothetical protein